MTMIHLDYVPSPIGRIAVVWDGDGVLRALDFEDYDARMRTLLRRHYGHAEPESGRVPAAIGDALRAYFDGDLGAIEGLGTRTNGSSFQQRVWGTLRTVPAGRTWTYGELATAIQRPSASRAVGLANGANPIAIVVPCHRVIGANGKLTGFGGGLPVKQHLLALERRARQPDLIASY